MTLLQVNNLTIFKLIFYNSLFSIQLNNLLLNIFNVLTACMNTLGTTIRLKETNT